MILKIENQPTSRAIGDQYLMLYLHPIQLVRLALFSVSLHILKN
ncbi:hypothetical protein VS86_02668 [Vibrio cholerae]|nr:hypothetical protein VS86_02668 [Vibrio cholerae]